MRTAEITSKCMCDSSRGRSAVRFVKNCGLKLMSDLYLSEFGLLACYCANRLYLCDQHRKLASGPSLGLGQDMPSGLF